MPVRGSTNYVWFTEQELGRGSTGTVYKGRHKRQGTFCAVKVFHAAVQQNYLETVLRELELSRRLDHRNIVKFIAIEDDTKNRDKVLIIELCSEGSVHDMLLKPDYMYGFPEDEFLQLFFDIGSGMEYLRQHNIVHRDIKPANILCNRELDKRCVYKFTDFGSARELSANEQFRSIVGTEEYLHPDVYGVAMFGASSTSGAGGPKFSAAVDLWSAGATLYHVATGRLPFKPFAGRDDKKTMYDIIQRKTSGFISGLQRKLGGRIEYSSTLPDICRLSAGLKKHLEPMLAGMLEKERSKQWDFKKFFSCLEDLKSRKVQHVYCVASITSHRCYLNHSDTVKQVLAELPPIVLNAGEGSSGSSATPVVPQVVERHAPLLFYEDRPLEDWVGGAADQALAKHIRSTYEHPLLLWSHLRVLRIYVQFPLKPEQVESEGAINIRADYEFARSVCGLLIYIRATQLDAQRSQVFINRSVKLLCSELLKRHSLLSSKFDSASLCLSLSISTFKQLSSLHPLVHPGVAGSKPGKAGHAAGLALASRVVEAETVKKLSEDMESLGRFKHHIDSAMNTYRTRYLGLINKKIVVHQPTSECETSRCTLKLDTHIENTRATVERFREQLTAELNYNEQQIHKYDKIKVDEWLNKAICLFNEHCLKGTERAFQGGIDFYTDSYEDWERHLSHLEKDINKFESGQQSFSEAVNKIVIELSKLGIKSRSGHVGSKSDRVTAESASNLYGSGQEASGLYGSEQEIESEIKGVGLSDSVMQGIIKLLTEDSSKMTADLLKMQEDTQKILDSIPM